MLSNAFIHDRVCRKCGDELSDENWTASCQRSNERICRECYNEQLRMRRKKNPEKTKATYTRRNRKLGHLPMSENRECASFLGIHVAERVLRHVFKDVVRMHNNNPGYDIICNHGKLIDSKAACMTISGGSLGKWQFRIRKNKIADYFVLLAFDNRDGINPLYCWMIPGDLINHLASTSISVTTIHKWDEYRLDINGVVDCCNALR